MLVVVVRRFTLDLAERLVVLQAYTHQRCISLRMDSIAATSRLAFARSEAVKPLAAPKSMAESFDRGVEGKVCHGAGDKAYCRLATLNVKR